MYCFQALSAYKAVHAAFADCYSGLASLDVAAVAAGEEAWLLAKVTKCEVLVCRTFRDSRKKKRKTW
jgi:hypothetical protein